MISIELLLDAATDAGVRAEWAALEGSGMPSLARHASESNRPHVTLFVAERIDDEDLAAVRAAVSSLPVPLALGGLQIFGAGRRGFVLARSVVMTDALLTLHRRVHAAAAPLAASIVALSRPDAWTPHVTLARRLTAEQVGQALVAIGAVALPAGVATGARLWDGAAKRVTPLGPGP